MRKTIIGLLALGAGLAPLPSMAQGIEIGPGGVRVDPGYRRGYDRGDDFGIGRREAVRAARGEGLDEVDGVDRRGPRWIVRGSDRRGRDLTVVVDARTGDVTDVRRD